LEECLRFAYIIDAVFEQITTAQIKIGPTETTSLKFGWS